MGFRQTVNDSLSIILKIMAIIAITIGVLWFGLSIWGNIAIDNDKSPDPPKESKAGYEILLHATGQTLYSNKVSDLGNGRIELNGYYEIEKDKWIYRNIDISLDKYYFGDITVRRR